MQRRALLLCCVVLLCLAGDSAGDSTDEPAKKAEKARKVSASPPSDLPAATDRTALPEHTEGVPAGVRQPTQNVQSAPAVAGPGVSAGEEAKKTHVSADGKEVKKEHDAPAEPTQNVQPAAAAAGSGLSSGGEAKKEHDTSTGPDAAADGGEPLVDMEQVMTAVGAVATLCCIAGGWFLMNQGGRKRRRFRGDAVFLVGPCDSGKTAMMMQLRDDEPHIRPTHSSMSYNESTFSLAGMHGRAVRMIDFPGHARLRPQLFDMIEDCAALVFVIDSSSFAANARDIASFLLDLLTSEKMLKHCTRMLILCNKTDALSDELAGISPKVMVKKRLETEIEALRLARAEALDDIANSMRVELEIAGSVFKWSDAPVEVEFSDGSVRDGKLENVKNFIAQTAGG